MASAMRSAASTRPPGVSISSTMASAPATRASSMLRSTNGASPNSITPVIGTLKTDAAAASAPCWATSGVAGNQAEPANTVTNSLRSLRKAGSGSSGFGVTSGSQDHGSNHLGPSSRIPGAVVSSSTDSG